ncbi:MAG: 30S ribosomal protein S4 [Bacilli bacterium]|nr:30S ribosomal protein S4 [Bacilli bacterium]
MARYTGPSYRKSRRLGFSILETGKELTRKPSIPGQHGKARQKKLSDYGVQLHEKQKARFMYGLTEKQFKRTFNDAAKQKGVHGENLLKLLESRLDNLAYRIGFASTRRGSRQLVNHGHITVNGKKVDIPSYRCTPGDVIAIKENDKEMTIVKTSLEALHNRVEFITFDEKKLAGTYVRYPERSELNPDINESLIVEYYNR